MTQERAVLKYMQEFGSITSFEAFQELGITRISARIFELRDKGHEIISIPMKTKNRYGNTVNFVKYKLQK